MDPNHVLDKFETLIKETAESQNKVASSLDKATLLLENERKKYEEFNKRNWFARHKVALAFFSPFVVIILILVFAYLFAATGHPIYFKVSDIEIRTE